jgi:dienelactone hydrolase
MHLDCISSRIDTTDIVSTYFAYPKTKSKKHAILILTDVLGHTLINAQLIADQFASKGYFVVMPDLFSGDVVPINRPESFNIMDWVKDHLPLQTEPIIDTVLKEMRDNLGCERIGGVGYCFGGKYVCRYLKPRKIDVGFTAHPTMVEVQELQGIEGPLSIAAAGMFMIYLIYDMGQVCSDEIPLPFLARDVVFTTAKRHESEEILDRLDVPYQINLFSDVEHGFAVRCDLSKPGQRFAKEQAFSQAVAWFDRHLIV